MVTETLARILFLVLLGAVLVMRGFFMIQVRKAGERVMPDRTAIRREGRIIFAARVVSFFLLMAFLMLYVINVPWMAVLSAPFPSWLRWIGFCLGLAAVGFWTWAQAVLGKEWSPQLQLREKHRLVTSGPYAVIRHPIYTAMFGYSLSLALVTANWVFVAMAALVIVGLIARIPAEERMMLEEFGTDYKTYMQNTGKFFPK